MQRCVNCGHQNRPGELFCEKCNTYLHGKMPLDTKSISATEDAKPSLEIDVDVLTETKVQGRSTFNETDVLHLEIEGHTEPIILKPQPEIIFGRQDPTTGAIPEVDLTPFAGYRLGISRRHAEIRLGNENNLTVRDLGSSNGTFLNGQGLSAHRPYPVHDGAELRLGQMKIRIHFQPGSDVPDATPEQTTSSEEKNEKTGAAMPQPNLVADKDDVKTTQALSVTAPVPAAAAKTPDKKPKQAASKPDAAKPDAAPESKPEEKPDKKQKKS